MEKNREIPLGTNEQLLTELILDPILAPYVKRSLKSYARQVMNADPETFKQSWVNGESWQGCATQWFCALDLDDHMPSRLVWRDDVHMIQTMMNYSNYGMLIQAFAVQAVCGVAEQMVALDPAECDKVTGEELAAYATILGKFEYNGYTIKWPTVDFPDKV